MKKKAFSLKNFILSVINFDELEKQLNGLRDYIVENISHATDESIEHYVDKLKIGNFLEKLPERLDNIEKALNIAKPDASKETVKPRPKKKALKEKPSRKTGPMNKNILKKMRQAIIGFMTLNNSSEIKLKQITSFCREAGYNENYADDKKFARAVGNALSRNDDIRYDRQKKSYFLPNQEEKK